MIKAIKDYYWSKKLAGYNCKFASGLSSLSNKITLVLEGPVRMGRVSISGGVYEIGAHSYIRSGSELYGDCKIGRYCSIGSNVVIGLEKSKHPLNWLTTSLFTRELEARYAAETMSETTKIGHDCWIGRGAIIMSGVEVGHGAIIAAGSIVTQDVPPYAIFAGVPAKPIKYRFDDALVEKIIASHWWDYPSDFLARLPLDKPESCLAQLGSTQIAQYKRVRLSRIGVSVLR